MKIISNTYKFEKICTGTLEFELNETDPTFLRGRSGGSSYVAAFSPLWIDEYILHGADIVKSDSNDWKNAWTYHIGEHRGRPYYNDIKSWLHGAGNPDGKRY